MSKKHCFTSRIFSQTNQVQVRQVYRTKEHCLPTSVLARTGCSLHLKLYVWRNLTEFVICWWDICCAARSKLSTVSRGESYTSLSLDGVRAELFGKGRGHQPGGHQGDWDIVTLQNRDQPRDAVGGVVAPVAVGIGVKETVAEYVAHRASPRCYSLLNVMTPSRLFSLHYQDVRCFIAKDPDFPTGILVIGIVQKHNASGTQTLRITCA